MLAGGNSGLYIGHKVRNLGKKPQTCQLHWNTTTFSLYMRKVSNFHFKPAKLASPQCQGCGVCCDALAHLPLLRPHAHCDINRQESGQELMLCCTLSKQWHNIPHSPQYSLPHLQPFSTPVIVFGSPGMPATITPSITTTHIHNITSLHMVIYVMKTHLTNILSHTSHT